MSSNKHNIQRSTILYFWAFPQRTSPLNWLFLYQQSNIISKKKQKTGNVVHRKGNGRPKKLGPEKSRELEQCIRNNNSPLRTLAIELSKDGEHISHMTVGRRLKELGYKNSLPISTPMLTNNHKTKWVEWDGHKHLTWNTHFHIFVHPSNHQP